MIDNTNQPELGLTDEEIRQILVNFYDDISGTVEGLVPEYHQLEIGRAHAAIRELIQGIIGEDDRTVITSRDSLAETRRISQNQLRAEQRNRLGDKQ